MPTGCPNARMVLLKGFDERGFVFYTNIDSQKGRELDATRRRRWCFTGNRCSRQVRVRGPVEPVTRRRGRRLFRHPPEAGADRRLGQQAVGAAGKPLAFEKAVALYAAKYAIGAVPRPPNWSRLPHRAAAHRVLARPAVPPARPHRVHARGSRTRRGARRGCIREQDRRANGHLRTQCRIRTSNQPRRTLLLTGASRGIGHATVKRFSAAGWRVITCSRHPFPENCPWDAGPRGSHPGRSRRP